MESLITPELTVELPDGLGGPAVQAAVAAGALAPPVLAEAVSEDEARWDWLGMPKRPQTGTVAERLRAEALRRQEEARRQAEEQARKEEAERQAAAEARRRAEEERLRQEAEQQQQQRRQAGAPAMAPSESPYAAALARCTDLACLKVAAQQARAPGQFAAPAFFVVGGPEGVPAPLLRHLEGHPSVLPASQEVRGAGHGRGCSCRAAEEEQASA